MPDDQKARMERLQAVLAHLDETRNETERLVEELLAQMDARQEDAQEDPLPADWPHTH